MIVRDDQSPPFLQSVDLQFSVLPSGCASVSHEFSHFGRSSEELDTFDTFILQVTQYPIVKMKLLKMEKFQSTRHLLPTNQCHFPIYSHAFGRMVKPAPVSKRRICSDPRARTHLSRVTAYSQSDGKKFVVTTVRFSIT